MAEPISQARARRIEWAAHHEPWIWPVIVAGTFLMGWWMAPHGTLWVVGALPALAVGVYVAACGNTHRRMECVRCWRAAPPARYSTGAVTKHRWALWWAHVTDNCGAWLLIPLAAAVFVPFPVVFVSGVVGLAVVTSSTSWAIVKHKQLLRWCPRCPRHGGGDDGGSARVPPPAPLMTGGK